MYLLTLIFGVFLGAEPTDNDNDQPIEAPIVKAAQQQLRDRLAEPKPEEIAQNAANLLPAMRAKLDDPALTFKQRFVIAARIQELELQANLPALIKECNKQREQEKIARDKRIAALQEQAAQLASEAQERRNEIQNFYAYNIPSNSGSKSVFVNGYFRKDGTYVRPHYRKPPRKRR